MSTTSCHAEGADLIRRQAGGWPNCSLTCMLSYKMMHIVGSVLVAMAYVKMRGVVVGPLGGNTIMNGYPR